MRIIFDENFPHPLRQFLPDDQVATVQELGWSGIENGELVARAEAECNLLILADKNLRYQQNLKSRRLAILELPTNRWPVLQSRAVEIAAAIRQIKSGKYVVIKSV